MDSATNCSSALDMKLFRHQVAGQLPMLSVEGTVCKPAILREETFYGSVKEQFPKLLPFLPVFRAVIQLDSTLTSSTVLKSVYVHSDLESDDGSNSDHINDWGVELLRSSRLKMSKLQGRYIILDDLTAGYVKPCIIDIKLGTRQYGVNATPAKIASKTRKTESTTSKSIGMRLCGFQSYRVDCQEYLCRDKFYGRTLTKESFAETLFNFFCNGVSFRAECVRLLLERAVKLTQILEENHDSYVFIACSVLIVYEGIPLVTAEEIKGPEDFPAIDLRLIDFAHTHKYEQNESHIDSGILFGLYNLIRILKELLSKSPLNINQ